MLIKHWVNGYKKIQEPSIPRSWDYLVVVYPVVKSFTRLRVCSYHEQKNDQLSFALQRRIHYGAVSDEITISTY